MRKSNHTVGGYRACLGTISHRLTLALAAFCAAGAAHAQTTLRFDVGFEGFVPGDVYFTSSLNSADDLTLDTTLFRFSPIRNEISEVMCLSGNGTFRDLAFDPISGGLYVADVDRLQLLMPDGEFIDVLEFQTRHIDLAVGPEGRIFTTEGGEIVSYEEGSRTQLASFGTIIRGLDVRLDGGFIAAIELDELEFGDDNLLWISPTGEIERRAQISVGKLGKVRARGDGTFVVLSDFSTRLNLVQPDGSFTRIPDRPRQYAEIAVDRDGHVWAATGLFLNRFSVDGTELLFVPLDLEMFGFLDNPGLFSPSGIAVVPGTPSAAAPFWPTLP